MRKLVMSGTETGDVLRISSEETSGGGLSFYDEDNSYMLFSISGDGEITVYCDTDVDGLNTNSDGQLLVKDEYGKYYNK